jgi:hypothetical protein
MPRRGQPGRSGSALVLTRPRSDSYVRFSTPTLMGPRMESIKNVFAVTWLEPPVLSGD